MDILQKITSIEELATIPAVAFRVMELLENPNANARDIAILIETDPVMTLKILRIANSPLYGFRSEIYSVQQAIVALGLNRIANILIGVAFFSRFFKSSQNQDNEMLRFWQHSIAVGTVARTLAQKLRIRLNEREFVAGLLHDIGKMVFVQYFPEEYNKVAEIVATEHIRDEEAEKRIFGVSHTEVGGSIAKLWQLPADLSIVIEHHSDDDMPVEYSALCSVVRIADIFCEIWGTGVNEGITEVILEKESAWATLCLRYPNLAELDIERFTFELESEFKKADLYMQLVT